MTELNLMKKLERIDEELELNYMFNMELVQNGVSTWYVYETLCCEADGPLCFLQAGTFSGHVASFLAVN